MTSGPVRAVIAAVGLFSEHLGPRADAGADPAEPTNVTAGGHSCPFRHRCTGCTYFRTDPSYTPELRAYLAQLLTDSERLATAIPALADWARADATPSDEAIDAVRRLLRANDEVLTALDDEDRAAVEEAITAIRTQRATLDMLMRIGRRTVGSIIARVVGGHREVARPVRRSAPAGDRRDPLMT